MIRAAKPGIELMPDDYFAPLRLAEVFQRDAPLEVDVGSGPGRFLLAMAQKFPERNFLGLERMRGRVQSSCGAAARLGLTNVRVLRNENYFAVSSLLPANSVSVFHVAFPDPWPKRRHWPRRLLNADFFDAVGAALLPGGELRIKTDDAPYFAQICSIATGRGDLQVIEWPDEPTDPQTDFERKFRAQDLPIYSLRLRKI